MLTAVRVSLFHGLPFWDLTLSCDLSPLYRMRTIQTLAYSIVALNLSFVVHWCTHIAPNNLEPVPSRHEVRHRSPSGLARHSCEQCSCVDQTRLWMEQACSLSCRMVTTTGTIRLRWHCPTQVRIRRRRRLWT